MFIKINLGSSNHNETLHTDKYLVKKKKKKIFLLNNKMLNRLIKKKNLPIIRLKMVKYTYKWLTFILNHAQNHFDKEITYHFFKIQFIYGRW
jgi:hypothetical protein